MNFSEGCRCGSVTDHLSRMFKAMGSPHPVPKTRINEQIIYILLDISEKTDWTIRSNLSRSQHSDVSNSRVHRRGMLPCQTQAFAFPSSFCEGLSSSLVERMVGKKFGQTENEQDDVYKRG